MPLANIQNIYRTWSLERTNNSAFRAAILKLDGSWYNPIQTNLNTIAIPMHSKVVRELPVAPWPLAPCLKDMDTP